MMRRLGRRWQQLHRLIYPIALLGVVHYLWLVKKDMTQPLIFGAVLALLLVMRLPWGLSALHAIRGVLGGGQVVKAEKGREARMPGRMMQ